MVADSPISGVFPAPVLHPAYVVRLPEVIAIHGLPQPASLTELFTGVLTCRFGAESLVIGIPVVGYKGLQAMRTSPVLPCFHGETYG